MTTTLRFWLRVRSSSIEGILEGKERVRRRGWGEVNGGEGEQSIIFMQAPDYLI
jgi:hypothetical protein